MHIFCRHWSKSQSKIFLGVHHLDRNYPYCLLVDYLFGWVTSLQRSIRSVGLVVGVELTQVGVLLVHPVGGDVCFLVDQRLEVTARRGAFLGGRPLQLHVGVHRIGGRVAAVVVSQLWNIVSDPVIEVTTCNWRYARMLVSTLTLLRRFKCLEFDCKVSSVQLLAQSGRTDLFAIGQHDSGICVVWTWLLWEWEGLLSGVWALVHGGLLVIVSRIQVLNVDWSHQRGFTRPFSHGGIVSSIGWEWSINCLRWKLKLKVFHCFGARVDFPLTRRLERKIGLLVCRLYAFF
jgi:hypothetical protein